MCCVAGFAVGWFLQLLLSPRTLAWAWHQKPLEGTTRVECWHCTATHWRIKTPMLWFCFFWCNVLPLANLWKLCSLKTIYTHIDLKKGGNLIIWSSKPLIGCIYSYIYLIWYNIYIYTYQPCLTFWEIFWDLSVSYSSFGFFVRLMWNWHCNGRGMLTSSRNIFVFLSRVKPTHWSHHLYGKPSISGCWKSLNFESFGDFVESCCDSVWKSLNPLVIFQEIVDDLFRRNSTR